MKLKGVTEEGLKQVAQLLKEKKEEQICKECGEPIWEGIGVKDLELCEECLAEKDICMECGGLMEGGNMEAFEEGLCDMCYWEKSTGRAEYMEER